MTKVQSAAVYKPWAEDSRHSVYDTANQRRVDLFEEKIEGLQVKVKRVSEGGFVVKTRVPVPVKASSKKKLPAKKKIASVEKKEEQLETNPPATSKKKPTRKTSRKRK